jgi:Uma2 family endonuclease
MSVKTPITVEELAHLPDDGRRYELDEGALITLAPACDEHGDVGAEIVTLLRTFVKQHSLGKVCTLETGFVLEPGTVRVPDIAFVRRERVVLCSGRARSGR